MLKKVEIEVPKCEFCKKNNSEYFALFSDGWKWVCNHRKYDSVAAVSIEDVMNMPPGFSLGFFKSEMERLGLSTSEEFYSMHDRFNRWLIKLNCQQKGV